MLFDVACALLLLIAQTTLAAWSFDPSRPCKDALDEGFCRMILKRGDCHKGTYVDWTERVCWKTCGNCEPEPKETKKPCNNILPGPTCYELYERGQCDITKELCANTCRLCE
ncbi:hypothetical protein V3C99_015100 [Haemonchus contortus]